MVDLRNLEITVEELLKNEQANKLLKREFPALANSPLPVIYSNKSIGFVIEKSKNIVSPEKLNRIISELKNI